MLCSGHILIFEVIIFKYPTTTLRGLLDFRHFVTL